MQKSYCDVCNKEIGASELRGGFLKYKEVYPVSPPESGQFQASKEIQPEVSDLCQKCTEKGTDFFEKRSKESREESLKAAEKVISKKT